jgi:NTE family protein
VHDTSIGLVLSGGGARGAYEVGVLHYIARELPALLERVRVITGTSVGAVNAAFLASRGLTPAAVADLAHLWRGLRVDELVSLSHVSAVRLALAAPLRLLSSSVTSPALGLLRADRLWTLIGRGVEWTAIHRHVRGGRFDAVGLVATDISTGDGHLFVDAGEGLGLRPGARLADLIVVPTALELRHVLASSAMPLLFRPVKVDGRWYMDGGVRNNTPLAPALRLGAERLLIMGVGGSRSESATGDAFPGIGQVIGKLLDAVFLDRVAYDLDRLRNLNDVARAVEQLGPAEYQKWLLTMNSAGRPRFRQVPFAYVGPSQDLGAIAAKVLRSAGAVAPFSFIRALHALFEDDAASSGDAASFLLFDRSFAQELIELGHADARAHHDELAALLS